MTRHSIRTFTTLALISGLLVPASSSASALLSGYGAPGAGDQAILGSALVGGSGANGGGNGRGSSNSGGQGQGGAGVAASGAGPSNRTGTPNGAHDGSASARNSAVGTHRNSIGAGGSTQNASEASRSAYGTSAGTHVSVASAADVDSGTLGLSASDLLIILMVAGGLALTGGLTRRLARMSY